MALKMDDRAEAIKTRELVLCLDHDSRLRDPVSGDCSLDTYPFLTRAQSEAIVLECLRYRDLLDLRRGCLIHKDLALWNIMGRENRIEAYIDWDDAISGDPMDDLSLLGCFYEGSVLERAVAGYRAVRPLREDHESRFWLHLLRNMIVKSVIRVGPGYFDRDDRFFLLEPSLSGRQFKAFTKRQKRLLRALEGLQEHASITGLSLVSS